MNTREYIFIRVQFFSSSKYSRKSSKFSRKSNNYSRKCICRANADMYFSHDLYTTAINKRCKTVRKLFSNENEPEFIPISARDRRDFISRIRLGEGASFLFTIFGMRIQLMVDRHIQNLYICGKPF